jgi:UPF0755 protein
LGKIGRFFALSVAFITLFGAFGGLIWNASATLGLSWVASEPLSAALEAPCRETVPHDLAAGLLSTSLCGLSSPDDVVIGTYLEARAAELNQPAGDDDTPITFAVQPGETAGNIADRLAREGLISDAELFKRYVQHKGLDAGIEAGEFTLRKTMTIPQIAQALQEARRPEQMVTIREGLRLEQVAAEVAQQTTIAEDAFLQLATTGWRDQGYAFRFLSALPADASLEGFLFPDTYRLPENPSAGDLVERMLSTFDERVTRQIEAAGARRGMNLYQVVTLASIVEREAVLDEERPVIAGVYDNRLEFGWTLDACPTVQYALGGPGNWWPRFTLEATTAASPYNTYQNAGLPPGPICSPGLAAIKAAAQPADTDYFFFLADCTKDDGSHLFAVTEEEHYANYAICGGQAP